MSAPAAVRRTPAACDGAERTRVRSYHATITRRKHRCGHSPPGPAQGRFGRPRNCCQGGALDEAFCRNELAEDDEDRRGPPGEEPHTAAWAVERRGARGLGGPRVVCTAHAPPKRPSLAAAQGRDIPTRGGVARLRRRWHRQPPPPSPRPSCWQIAPPPPENKGRLGQSRQQQWWNSSCESDIADPPALPPPALDIN